MIKQLGQIKMMKMDVKPAVDTGRRAWWAYLGALGLAQDEVMRVTNKMMERGTLTEKETWKLVHEALSWPQRGVKMVEGELQKQIEIVLERLGVLTRADIEKMNLPTRADIQTLSEKVAGLTKKVDQLRKVEEHSEEKVEAAPVKPQAVRKTSESKKAVQEEVPVDGKS